MDQAKFPLEEVMSSLKTLKEEGLFGGVGLSEVSGETVRRAAKVGFSQFLWRLSVSERLIERE